MSEIIYLSNVRLSFPHLIEPQVITNQKTGKVTNSYNADFILAQDHPGYIEFMKRYSTMALEQWRENANAIMGLINTDRKSRCYGAGQEKIDKKTFQPYKGYQGLMYITASSKERLPQIIQADGNPVDPANTMACQAITRKLYGGCRVNVAIKPWIQKPGDGYSHGIRCDLIAIQFAGDDEPFGEGAVDAAPMFGAVAVAAQAPGLQAGVMPGAPVFGGIPGATAPQAAPGALPGFMTPQ